MGFFSRKKTVEDIVAPITSIVTELRDHAATHDAKAEKHIELVDHHHIQAAEAQAEANKASSQASKIAGLLT